jgi:TPR repeat protein
MGLISRLKGDRKKGHTRTETSSSSIIGSDFLAAASESSHSSTDTHPQQVNASKPVTPSKPNELPPPPFTQAKLSTQSAPRNTTQRKQPPLTEDPALLKNDLLVSSMAPHKPRVLSPESRTQRVSELSPSGLYSPKVRKNASSAVKSPHAGHSRSASRTKSPLGLESTPEHGLITSNLMGDLMGSTPYSVNTSTVQPSSGSTLRSISRSSFAVSGSLLSDYDLTSSSADNDDPANNSGADLDMHRQYFAIPPREQPGGVLQSNVTPTHQFQRQSLHLQEGSQGNSHELPRGYTQGFQGHPRGDLHVQGYAHGYARGYQQEYPSSADSIQVLQQMPQPHIVQHQAYQRSSTPSLRRLSTVLSNLINSYDSESKSDLGSTRIATIKSSRNSSMPASMSDLKRVGDRTLKQASLETQYKAQPQTALPVSGRRDYDKENTTGEPNEAENGLNPNQYRYISDYDKFFFGNDEISADLKATEVRRADSSSSEKSYKSIERGDLGKFKVTSSEERLERIKSNTAKFNRVHEQAKQSLRQHAAQQVNHRLSTPNLNPMYQANVSLASTASFQTAVPSSRMSMVSPNYGGGYGYPYEYLGPMPDRRSMMMPYGYSYQQAPAHFQQQQQLMMMGAPRTYNPSRSSSPNRGLGGGLPRNVTDPNLVKKIDDYVSLRNVIAAGNKSLEYRLKWVKMLISSTNSRLYNHINIKGEPISPESITHHRALFIKSSINHTMKLLKECDGKEEYEEILSEVCYIYGCLLKTDYLALYQQDYGFTRDVDSAMKYFERSIELRANNFRSMHKLGEIYEDDFSDMVITDNDVESPIAIALRYYKQAAQYGYNKSIYRISLIYLTQAEFRSPKCVKYLMDLSNIDVNSKDINLEADDRDELDHIVAMAAFQMAKIYEGLYPPDLTADCEFVVKCLAMAPVNYTKALAYYNKAAKLHNVQAQAKLGQVYEFGGLNRQQNANKSIQWYLKTVSSTLTATPSVESMLGLARWYVKGSEGMNRSIPYPDSSKALAWCERAMQTNDPESFYTRGLLAEQGLGNEPAEQFFERAYQMGHFEAGVKLGYNAMPVQQTQSDDELFENVDEEDHDQTQEHIEGSQLNDGVYDLDLIYQDNPPSSLCPT